MRFAFSPVLLLMALLSYSTPLWACNCSYGGETFKETFLNFCKNLASANQNYFKYKQSGDEPKFVERMEAAGLPFSLEPDFKIFSRYQQFVMADAERFSFGQAYSLMDSGELADYVHVGRPGQVDCTTLSVFPVANRISITFVNQATASTEYQSCGINSLDLYVLDEQGQPTQVTAHQRKGNRFFSKASMAEDEDDVYLVGSIDQFAQKPMPLSEFKGKLAGWISECQAVFGDSDGAKSE